MEKRANAGAAMDAPTTDIAEHAERVIAAANTELAQLTQEAGDLPNSQPGSRRL